MIVRKLEALFTLNTNAVQFKRATSELDKLASKAEGVMNAIAGYWAVQGLQNFVANTANAMAEIGKSAEYIGVGANALQELRYAAEKSGVSVDALNDALKEIQVRAMDAAQSGKGEAAEAFQKLGLKSTDAAGRIREPLELLDAVADRMKALRTQSERIWVADAIFGDEGSMVLKMLKGGAQGLKEMRQEARTLGITLSSNSIESASRFNQALKKLQHTSNGVGRAFVENLLPSLSWLMEKLSCFAVAINSARVSSSMFDVALLSLSATLAAVAIKAALAFAPILIAAAPVIAKVALITAGVVALIAVVEDIWVAFNGGNSVFGQLWQTMNSFFAPFEKKLCELPHIISRSTAEAWQAMTKGFADAWASMQQEFSKFSSWFNDKATALIPDFLKKGFSTTAKVMGTFHNYSDPSQLNGRLAPTSSNISHQSRVSSNQNVNVAVNVASQASPYEIGGEVSKAVKQALERERFNAFMGVTQYAG
jgi:hypothetical protein